MLEGGTEAGRETRSHIPGCQHSNTRRMSSWRHAETRELQGKLKSTGVVLSAFILSVDPSQGYS